MKKKEPKLSKRKRAVIEKLANRFLKEFQKSMERLQVQPVEILPLDIQGDILKQSGSYFKDPQFREDAVKKDRKILHQAAKSLHTFLGQLERTQKAVQDALTVVHAEQDSRDIGPEPTDDQLIKDERRRGGRLARYQKRLRTQGSVKEGEK